jgi:FixJ family two-component response regulator
MQSKLRTISPSTRVIVLTGNEDARVRAMALSAGASAFFIKPLDMEEFLDTLRVPIIIVSLENSRAKKSIPVSGR